MLKVQSDVRQPAVQQHSSFWRVVTQRHTRGLSYLHGDYYGMCASRRSRPTDTDVSMTKPRLYVSRKKKKRGTERAAGKQIFNPESSEKLQFQTSKFRIQLIKVTF